MAQKTRKQLQDLFKQGAKPSGDDFSDFVESTFNIKDDGLEKPVGADAPLKIISYGAEENLLDFYTGNSHSWRLNQKPSAAETAGLNFENAAGSSKLFIANSSGNVGIGTTNPDSKLEVIGAVKATELEGNSLNFYVGDSISWSFINKPPKTGSSGLYIKASGGQGHLFITSSTGNVGIGTDFPDERLDVEGTVKAMAFEGNGAKLTNLSADEITSGTLAGSLTISADGNVGIGTTTPRTALDMGTGVMSGASNDYQRAQFMLSRGGTVTWKNSTTGSVTGNRLKWTSSFFAISMERQTTFYNGYLNINQPSSDIPAENVFNGQARSVTADGVLLNTYEALYAVHTVGGGSSEISFQIRHYTRSFYAPSNWLLVAVVGNEGTVKLGTGLIISLNSSHSDGSPIPVGTIVMWSGASDTIPSGWALCDGANGTPDLRNRFLVGAGSSYSVGNIGGSNTVTLNTNQMPQHNHSASTNTTGSHQHRMIYDTGGGGNKGSGTMPKTIGYTANALANYAINTPSSGSHSHSVTIGYKGRNGSHENRPPYYAVYFIMKL